MFSFKVHHLLFLFIFHGYDCQRRIKDGQVVTAEKSYMVYLIKASVSPRSYDGWLCGGALVSPDYIVTSAACVTDVAHLYAIAGYKKYISDVDIYQDPCTKAKKKKIIQICTHKSYSLVYEKPEVWSDIDIAVVKVESPYDFNDATYATVCSYTPSSIPINYALKYQEPGTDALVLGWGHQTSYREEMDLSDYNQEQLYYAPVLIEDKETCKVAYTEYEGMATVIDQYMICTIKAGNINDQGVTILKSEPAVQGCVPPQQKLQGLKKVCVRPEPEEDILLIENSRKGLKLSNLTSNADQNSNHSNNVIKQNVVNSNFTQNSSQINKMNQNNLNSTRRNTRRNGFCQNDHGGPLVTWVGAHEVLIGIASAFRIAENRECIGPYLFTSTQCNGLFLDCILHSDLNSLRRATCTKILQGKGFSVLERYISWKDHPAGPADNERNIPTHFKEEKEERAQDYNITELVNTTYTDTTYNAELLNLIGITKDATRINNSTTNLVNTTNLTNSAL